MKSLTHFQLYSQYRCDAEYLQFLGNYIFIRLNSVQHYCFSYTVDKYTEYTLLYSGKQFIKDKLVFA